MNASLAATLAALAGSFVAQSLLFLGTTAVVYLLVWRWKASAFARRRIQPQRRADAAQIRRELVNSLLTFVAGASIALLVLVASQHGYTRLTTRVDDVGVPILALSGLAMIVINDAWFYAIHRLLHTRWWFRRVHHVHHRSIDVTPFSAYSFHPLEGWLLTAWIVPYVLLVPTYAPVLVAVQLFGYLENLKSHLGYEFYPRWFGVVFPSRWLTTATFHNVHHTEYRGNYALTFRWWDRILGTEVPDYDARFAALPRANAAAPWRGSRGGGTRERRSSS